MEDQELSSESAAESELPAQKQKRLAFIEFRALFLGEVKRSDITDFFGISIAAATRDIAAYRRESGEQIELDQSTKTYRPVANFRPIYEHPMGLVFAALSQGLGMDRVGEANSAIPSEIPRPLALPRWEIVAPVTRAIHQRRAVRVTYHSYSSGETERELVPHALVNNGSRWHVRAYDRQKTRFNDFVFTRMTQVTELPQSTVAPAEDASKDRQWTRIVELELVPHPAQKRPEVTALDYAMSDGVLRLNERAALVGYLLRQWNVDCSQDASEKTPKDAGGDKNTASKGDEITLWLRNPLALYGVESATIAPGYKPPA